MNGIQFPAEYGYATRLPLRICPYETKEEQRKVQIAEESNIFVKNLNENLSANQFWHMMKQFGNIRSCKMACHLNGKSKCHGFASYYRKEDAFKAIEELNNKEIGGKQLLVTQFKRGQRGANKENNVYVKHLPENYTQEQLEEHFSKYGKVNSAILIPGDKGKFAFVCFDKADSALKAIAETGKFTLEGASEPIYIGIAKSKQQRDEENKKNISEYSKKEADKTIFCRLHFKGDFEEYSEKDKIELAKQKIYSDIHEFFSNTYEPAYLNIVINRENAFLKMNDSEDVIDFLKQVGSIMDENQPFYVTYNKYTTKEEMLKAKREKQNRQMNNFNQFGPQITGGQFAGHRQMNDFNNFGGQRMHQGGHQGMNPMMQHGMNQGQMHQGMHPMMHQGMNQVQMNDFSSIEQPVQRMPNQMMRPRPSKEDLGNQMYLSLTGHYSELPLK